MVNDDEIPFRWPRRATSPGCVHVVVGDSRFGPHREQTACDMNPLKANYDRTVAPVNCTWCLLALKRARAGTLDGDGVDRAIRQTIIDTEAKHGADTSVETEA